MNFFSCAIRSLLLLYLLVLLSFAALSQQYDWYWIRTKNKAEYVGKRLSYDKDSFLLKLENGETLLFEESTMRRKEQIDSAHIVDGVYRWPDIADLQLHFFSSGKFLPKGEIRMHQYPIFTTAKMGITERWTGSVTFDGFSLALGVLNTFAVFNNRYRLTRNTAQPNHYSVGMINILAIGDSTIDQSSYFYAPYFSTRRKGGDGNYFTFSVGAIGYEGLFPLFPFYQGGGTIRLGTRHLFVTDNLIVPDNRQGGWFGMMTVGIRFLRKKTSWDAIIALPFESGTENIINPFPIPMAGTGVSIF